MIFAIDPGNIKSAYVIVGSDMQVLEHCKADNLQVEKALYKALKIPNIEIVCESVTCYGMPVGKEVFDTCKQIGRFEHICDLFKNRINYVPRIKEKTIICHDAKAKDSNIRRALIDKYAKFDFKNGKGNKRNPDWFQGFGGDEWSAFAVAETYKEMKKDANS